MHCVGVDDCIEDAQTKIIRPDFNLHLSKLNFFENCGAHLICRKGCFLIRSEVYAVLWQMGK